jgi:HlyD family secretion protein
MDLPHDTPAGSENASACESGDSVFAGEKPDVTPVGGDSEPSHSSGGDEGAGRRGLRRFFLTAPGSKTGFPFVLGGIGRAGRIDSTEGLYRRRETGAEKQKLISSPDAQGHKHMTTRRLSSIVAVAGVGLASLALHSCDGGKPSEGETVKAASAATQAMRVTRVAVRDLSEEVVASGRLVVREEAAVGSELAGYRVAAVYVDEGDWVKQGQALARLDDTLLQAQIAQAEATLATQKANVAFKKSQLERAESLTAEGAFSKEQLDQRRMEAVGAEASLAASQAMVNEMKVRSSRMTLRAPVAGMILQRAIRPGEISSPGAMTPYFRIARDGLIELDAELPDARLSLVKEGASAQVTLATGETLSGKVRFISPRVDQNTSLGRARIELPFDKALRPGGFAEARFGGLSTGGLTVPASAIRYESGGPALMAVDAANKVSKVPVKLGERMGDFVQLVEGPPAGTRVLAVGAAFTLEGDVIEPVEEGVAGRSATPGGK